MPITREIQDKILARVEEALPEGIVAMLIGGTLLLDAGAHPAGRTKDTDVVLLVHQEEGLDIPAADVVAGILQGFASEVQVRKDRTSVSGTVELEEGRFLVEAVRGRGAQGGYFVRRTLLKKVAVVSKPRGKLLVPPLEALAVLKAWAATDQDKLAATERDRRGFHQARAADFRRDVRRCLEGLLKRGQRPDTALVVVLLEACSRERRERVGAVLLEQGWTLG